MLHQLGAGSLGPVFRAHDPGEGRLVAIKAFHLDLTPERAAELAAALNALVARGLTHPSIATPLTAGVEGGTPWFAQSYVPAEALDGALRQYGPAPLAQLLTIVTHVAGALDFAAVEGVFHGSLHPRDVLVSPEETHVIDFGVAAVLEQCDLRAPVRRPYSAPERIAGGPPSRSADVFALGAIAFELLSGQPITGPDSASIGALPDIPGADAVALEGAFTSALASDPLARPVTALAFASALKLALGTAGFRSTPAVTPRRTRRVTSPPPGAAALPLEPSNEAATEAVPADGKRTPPRGVADTPPVPPKIESPPSSGPERHGATLLGVEHASPTPLDQLELYQSERREQIADEANRKAPEPLSPLAQTLTAPPRIPPPPLEIPIPLEELHRGSPLRLLEPQVPPRRSYMSLALLILLLVLGTAAGFAGGWVWALRNDASDADGAAPASDETTSSPATSSDAEAPRLESENVVSRPLPPEMPETMPDPAPAPAAKTPAAERTSRSVAARTPGSAAQTSGRLLIRSTPAGAAVEIDGRSRGVTPLALERIAFGAHSIVIRRPGYIPEKRRVTLTRGRPAQSLEVPLSEVGGARRASRETAAVAVGSVYVDSRPTGARVMLDGRDVGRTPLVVSDIRAGSHVVRLELDGHRAWTSSVRVVAGERNRVAASLEEATR